MDDLDLLQRSTSVDRLVIDKVFRQEVDIHPNDTQRVLDFVCQGAGQLSNLVVLLNELTSEIVVVWLIVFAHVRHRLKKRTPDSETQWAVGRSRISQASTENQVLIGSNDEGSIVGLVRALTIVVLTPIRLGDDLT